MKAWVLHGVDDICYEETARPQPADGEVFLRVQAAGICGSDIPRIYKTGAHIHPLIPGHEFSGIVEQARASTDPGWEGKHVGVFPLIPCGKCISCRKRQYELCRNYSYLGSRRDGEFAEYVLVPEWNLIEQSESVSFVDAAMLEPMAVASPCDAQSPLTDSNQYSRQLFIHLYPGGGEGQNRHPGRGKGKS